MKMLNFSCDTCNKIIDRKEYYYLIQKETPFIFITAKKTECPEVSKIKEKKEKRKNKEELSGNVNISYHFCSLEHLIDWTEKKKSEE